MKAPDGTPTRLAIILTVVVAVFSLALMNDLGESLGDMYLSGQRSGQVTDIAKIPSDADKNTAIVTAWLSWDKGRAGLDNEVAAPPGVVALWWLLIDSLLLAPSLALLLHLSAKRRRMRLQAPPTVGPPAPAAATAAAAASGSAPSPVQKFLGAIAPGDDNRPWLEVVLGMCWAGALLYLGADELENIATAFAIWHDPRIWAWVVTSLTVVKTATILVTALPIALSFIKRVRGVPLSALGPARVFTTLRLVRAPAAAATIAFLAMTALPGPVRPQLADVIRSWILGDRLDTAASALGMLVLLMALLAIGLTYVISRDATLPWHPGGPEEVATGREGKTDTSGPRRLLIYAIAGLLLVIVSLLVPARLPGRWLGDHWMTGVILGAGLVVYAGVSLPLPLRRWRAVRYRTLVNQNVIRAVLAAPPLGFALMVVRATDLVGPAEAKASGFILTIIGLALTGAGWWFGGRVRERSWNRGLTAAMATVGAVVLLAAISVTSRPLDTAWAIGAVGLVLLAASALVVFFVTLEGVFWNPPRAGFARLGLGRAPILILLLGVMVLASRFDTSTEYHTARTMPTDAPRGDVALTASNLLAAYDSPALSGEAANTEIVFVISTSGGGGRAAYWTLDVLNCLFAATAPPSFTNNDVPGLAPDPEGSEAACNAAAPWDRVMAASGISGGSVGLAMFSAARLDDADAPIALEDRFRDGYLDPVFAGMLFRDLPNAWLRVETMGDRAEVLELAFEKQFPQMADGFYQHQVVSAEEPRFPVLMLNSAGATDGCRINVSALDLSEEADSRSTSVAATDPMAETPTTSGSSSDPTTSVPPSESSDPSPPAATVDDLSCRSLEPARVTQSDGQDGETSLVGALSSTRDLDDYVCADDGDDLPLSTAAHLSARFPLISPTGALESCGTYQGEKTRIFAVDGGYVDTTAASPLTELFGRLLASTQGATPSSGTDGERRTCIQPVVLQIDNGYASEALASSPGRPLELLAPTTGQGSVSSGRVGASRQQLAQLATAHRCPLPPELEDLPSYLLITPQAHPGVEAPLGWSLSASARRDMDNQVLNPENDCALR